MASVTSAEFRRGFGHWRKLAQHEPVVITSHGCDSLVLLSADEYRRLKRLDREPLYPREMDESDIAALRSATAAEEADPFVDLAGAGEGDGRYSGADHDCALYGGRGR